MEKISKSYCHSCFMLMLLFLQFYNTIIHLFSYTTEDCNLVKNTFRILLFGEKCTLVDLNCGVWQHRVGVQRKLSVSTGDDGLDYASNCFPCTSLPVQ